MTLPASGSISMSQINAEFGRGNDLNAYRGTVWYNDAGGNGVFPSSPISFANFFSTRATSPHSAFGFNNFSGSPTLSNGDLTVSGYGVGLTDYGGARGANVYVDFQIDNTGCVVGVASSTPSGYPGDFSAYGFGLRQDGTLFYNQAGGRGGAGAIYLGVGYNPGDVVSVVIDSNGFVYFAVNGGGLNSVGFIGTSVYPCAMVEGGQVTLRTSGSYGYTTYWYP